MSSLLFSLYGAIFYFVGIVLRKWPPKKINYFYGYRTPRAMKNQKTWDAAQAYSAKIMRNQGLLFVILGGIAKILPTSEFLNIPYLDIILPLLIVILGVVYLIFKTEQHITKEILKID